MTSSLNEHTGSTSRLWVSILRNHSARWLWGPKLRHTLRLLRSLSPCLGVCLKGEGFQASQCFGRWAIKKTLKRNLIWFAAHIVLPVATSHTRCHLRRVILSGLSLQHPFPSIHYTAYPDTLLKHLCLCVYTCHRQTTKLQVCVSIYISSLGKNVFSGFCSIKLI